MRQRQEEKNSEEEMDEDEIGVRGEGSRVKRGVRVIVTPSLEEKVEEQSRVRGGGGR